MKKIFMSTLSFCLILVFGLCLAGCGKKEEVPVEVEGVQVLESMDSLERGRIYVEVEGGYASPYWGTTSFDPSSYVRNLDEKQVAWFNDKSWKKIPTVYAGGNVVYRTNQEFDEKFYFKKFADIGYTIGVCNMNATSTGRYKFSTSPDDKKINSESDASALYELQDTNVILDKLDNTKIRAANVSTCGTITGLKKDTSYAADIYVGTEIQSYILTADSRALQNIQVNQTDRYEFVQAEIIEIPIPETFVSGYYSVNGSGIFRYIAKADIGKEETEIDMNSLNAGDGSYVDYIDNQTYYEKNVTENIVIPNDGNYTMTITLVGDMNPELIPSGYTEKDIQPPYATLAVDVSNPVVFVPDSDGTLSATFDVVRGAYILEIKNTMGRSHTYALIKNEQPDSNTVSGGEETTAANEEIADNKETAADGEDTTTADNKETANETTNK